MTGAALALASVRPRIAWLNKQQRHQVQKKYIAPGAGVLRRPPRAGSAAALLLGGGNDTISATKASRKSKVNDFIFTSPTEHSKNFVKLFLRGA